MSKIPLKKKSYIINVILLVIALLTFLGVDYLWKKPLNANFEPRQVAEAAPSRSRPPFSEERSGNPNSDPEHNAPKDRASPREKSPSQSVEPKTGPGSSLDKNPETPNYDTTITVEISGDVSVLVGTLVLPTPFNPKYGLTVADHTYSLEEPLISRTDPPGNHMEARALVLRKGTRLLLIGGKAVTPITLTNSEERLPLNASGALMNDFILQAGSRELRIGEADTIFGSIKKGEISFGSSTGEDCCISIKFSWKLHWKDTRFAHTPTEMEGDLLVASRSEQYPQKPNVGFSLSSRDGGIGGSSRTSGVSPDFKVETAGHISGTMAPRPTDLNWHLDVKWQR